MRKDIVPGTVLPDYELPDHTDVKRKLTLLQGSDPMILMLGRHVTCPKERQFLLQMAAFSKQCTVGYVRLVTITTDSLAQSNDLRYGVGADWTFLHDEKRIIQTDLDIAEYTDPENNPMIPHVFVLEPGLKIYKIYQGYWYWGRPTISELHLDLRDISSRVRPDYDLSDPKLRAAWDKGQKDQFFPYDMSKDEVFARMANEVELFKQPS